jgi:hypothetical protein
LPKPGFTTFAPTVAVAGLGGKVVGGADLDDGLGGALLHHHVGVGLGLTERRQRGAMPELAEPGRGDAAHRGAAVAQRVHQRPQRGLRAELGERGHRGDALALAVAVAERRRELRDALGFIGPGSRCAFDQHRRDEDRRRDPAVSSTRAKAGHSDGCD